MILTFLLVVTVARQLLDTSAMHFRDIHRCNFFGRKLEKTVNIIWSGSHIIHGNKLNACCKPIMVSLSIKFWDWFNPAILTPKTPTA